MHSIQQILSDLVSIPSVNPMGDSPLEPPFGEAEIAEYVRQFLMRLSLDAVLEEVRPGRPNVIGFIEGKDRRRWLLLEAHLDTVSAGEMGPDGFRPRTENGLLYGRGACDTKAALAALLFALQTRMRQAQKPHFSLLIAGVADEEFGFSGARALLQQVQVPIEAAFVGEPTRLAIIHAHKGVVRWQLSTHGRSVHSAYPEQGENAIYRMATIVSALKNYAEQLTRRRIHPLLGAATLNVGTISGGTAVNMVPAHCGIEIDRRLLPSETPEQAEADLIQYLQASRLEFELSSPLVAAQGLDPGTNHRAVALLQRAARKTGGRLHVEAAMYATNAGIYSQNGIPAVVFGPGDIRQAHTANEFVELKQVEQASQIYFHLMMGGTSDEPA